MDIKPIISSASISQNTQESDDYCSICLKAFGKDVTVTPCNHTFCTVCIKTSLSTPINKRACCPLCRNELTELALSFGVGFRIHKRPSDPEDIARTQAFLSDNMINAINNGRYSDANGIGSDVYSAGITLTSEAYRVMSNALVLAINDLNFRNILYLRGIFFSMKAPLTSEAQTALNDGIIAAVKLQRFTLADTLKIIADNAGVKVSDNALKYLKKTDRACALM